MLSLIKCLFNLFLLSFLLSCQGTPTSESMKNTPIKAEDGEPEISSSLWKISKTGEPTSYLLGSLHFGRENDHLSPFIQRILAQSDIVYTEIKIPTNSEHPDDPDFLEFMQKAYDNKSGNRLEDKIGRERFTEVKKLFKEVAKKNILN